MKTCLYKLSIVDDTLEVLGISKEYQQLYKWTVQITIGWLLLTFIMNTCDSIWLNYKYISISQICVPFVANHMFHVHALNGLIWGIILKLVYMYTFIKLLLINIYIYNNNIQDLF